MSKEIIRSVIDRVLWTAGATEWNRDLLADAISDALAAAPQVAADERKPFAFVIVDKDRNPEFVTPDWDSAQEHINDACEMSIENAGKWKAIPAFEMRPTDDKLWDETMKDRDQYHKWADKLAEAIALYFGSDIGEHSNMNCPWAEALEIIEQAAPVQAQEPVAVVYPPDGTVSPFTVINLGHGLVKIGDSLHDGRLPALWFGKDGLGMGVSEEMNRAAKEGESLAVVTFSNVEGLDVLSEVVQRIRSVAFPDAPVQPVAMPDGWKLVPIEPTDAMILGPGALRTDGKVARIHRDVWKRMMEAVPAAPAAQGYAKDAERYRYLRCPQVDSNGKTPFIGWDMSIPYEPDYRILTEDEADAEIDAAIAAKAAS